MKRLGWRITGLIAGLLLMGSGIALVAQEESIDDTHKASSEIPYEAQILRFGLKNLNYLKRALPELHAEVMSPDWTEMDGSDKLRLVVKHMTNVWGTEEEAIDAYLSRIDEYMAKVPVEEREDVNMIFGMIGRQLLTHVFYMEQNKESKKTMMEVQSILWEDDDPGKLVEYERCLGQTIVALGVGTKETFDDWLNGVEEIAAGTNMFKPHASLHSETASELIGVSSKSFTAQLQCDPDWEADS
ncbi:MAG: hypothetical protein F4X44_10195 [Gammaproteobacteria bacterium]|nr:hypothetical protein [Gammaproteobacteria bacterium]